MFNHLKVPESWNSYFSKYPNGLTIMEALCDWVGQVDSMVDHINTVDEHIKNLEQNLEEFYLQFDSKLTEQIQNTLQSWIEDGTLEQVISQLIENRMTFPSIPALQQAPNLFKNGTVVELLGYHSAGDGAGHKRIIADVDDGSGVRLYNKWANVVYTTKVRLIDLGARDNTDISETLLKALALPKIQIISLEGLEKINIAKTVEISNGVEIDFSDCYIFPKTNNDLFVLKMTGENIVQKFEQRISLINYAFTKDEAYVPENYIKIDGAINTRLKGNFIQATASHALIYNYSGYGSRVFGEMRYCTAPHAIKLAKSSSNSMEYTYDWRSDVDITGHTGVGYSVDGGTLEIKGVVESCSLGGIDFTGNSIVQSALLSAVHMEYNKVFDIKFGKEFADNTGATNSGNIHVNGGSFGVQSLSVDPNYKLFKFGSSHNVTFTNCRFANAEFAPLGSLTKSTGVQIIGAFNTANWKLDASLGNDLIHIYGGNVSAKTSNLSETTTTKELHTNTIRAKNNGSDVVNIVSENALHTFNGTHLALPKGHKINTASAPLDAVYMNRLVLNNEGGSTFIITVDEQSQQLTVQKV